MRNTWNESRNIHSLWQNNTIFYVANVIEWQKVELNRKENEEKKNDFNDSK